MGDIFKYSKYLLLSSTETAIESRLYVVEAPALLRNVSFQNFISPTAATLASSAAAVLLVFGSCA